MGKENGNILCDPDADDADGFGWWKIGSFGS